MPPDPRLLWYNSRKAAIIQDQTAYTTTALRACGIIAARRLLYHNVVRLRYQTVQLRQTPLEQHPFDE